MMALVYQSADLFLCPSLADSGPMMIPEAMLCGIPVVAFDTGGAPDWIDHLHNGYLARIGDVADFADGIRTMLAADRQSCAAAARLKASGLHRPDLVARQHLNLYRELIEEHASDHQSRITK
jgi:glycosyltransferase involved in cell wall biosynthesis